MQHFLALSLCVGLLLGKPITIAEKIVFPRDGNGTRYRSLLGRDPSGLRASCEL